MDSLQPTISPISIWKFRFCFRLFFKIRIFAEYVLDGDAQLAKKSKLNLFLKKMWPTLPRKQIRTAKVSSMRRRNHNLSFLSWSRCLLVWSMLSSTTTEPRQLSSVIRWQRVKLGGPLQSWRNTDPTLNILFKIWRGSAPTYAPIASLWNRNISHQENINDGSMMRWGR